MPIGIKRRTRAADSLSSSPAPSSASLPISLFRVRRNMKDEIHAGKWVAGTLKARLAMEVTNVNDRAAIFFVLGKVARGT